MFYSSTIVVSLLFLATINQINCLQCYKCSCIIIPGEITCTGENDLQCVIEYVQNNYCYISQQSNNIQFGHRSNADLIFLESLHYIRAKEQIVYVESNPVWQDPNVIEFSYGCDWNLCNTPRILSLLPKGLTFVIDSVALTNALVLQPDETFESCLSCTKCVNTTGGLICSTPACNGTCFIDDYVDNPTLNGGSCLFAFESVCLNTKLDTSVQITGTYYIDDDKFGITEIDIWCKKTNCNDPVNVQTVQATTTYSTEINDQLYFRPDPGSTTPTPNNGLLACYQCYCTHDIGSDDCKILECTIEYQNASYCGIIRDFKDVEGTEIINLGHVQSAYLPYKHFISVEEELTLYKNLSWHPASVSLISYVCDWDLCNDGRLVDKLATSFQFNATPAEIATYLQSTEPLNSCFQCDRCTNSSLDFDTCTNVTCPSYGRCFIDELIDDPQFNDCEYAYRTECQDYASESSIIITATYSIDDDKLDIDEVDVYCTKNNCNRPETIFSLLNLIQEDINLDPLFYIRPFVNSTSPPIIIEPTPSGTTTTSNSVTMFLVFFIISIFIIH